MNTVFLKSFAPPPVDRLEVLRYAGVKEPSPETEALLDDSLQEAEGVFSYAVCYREFPVSFCDGVCDLSFAKTESKDLFKNLSGSTSVVLFAATVGITLDRLVSRYSKISPARALMLNAIGAERIESLCNAFNQEITKEKKALGLFTTPRFSPGYGDLPLALQKDIFAVLDCPRKIGLTLNESLIMSPTKSVTALIGVTPCDRKNTKDRPCSGCNKADCAFRRII